MKDCSFGRRNPLNDFLDKFVHLSIQDIFLWFVCNAGYFIIIEPIIQPPSLARQKKKRNKKQHSDASKSNLVICSLICRYKVCNDIWRFSVRLIFLKYKGFRPKYPWVTISTSSPHYNVLQVYQRERPMNDIWITLSFTCYKRFPLWLLIFHNASNFIILLLLLLLCLHLFLALVTSGHRWHLCFRGFGSIIVVHAFFV